VACPKAAHKSGTYRSLRYLELAALVPSAGTITNLVELRSAQVLLAPVPGRLRAGGLEGEIAIGAAKQRMHHVLGNYRRPVMTTGNVLPSFALKAVCISLGAAVVIFGCMLLLTILHP
jgi:hypothetical protein